MERPVQKLLQESREAPGIGRGDGDSLDEGAIQYPEHVCLPLGKTLNSSLHIDCMAQSWHQANSQEMVVEEMEINSTKSAVSNGVTGFLFHNEYPCERGLVVEFWVLCYSLRGSI